MEEYLKIRIDANIKIPTIPNFIFIKTRKNTPNFDSKVSIGDFTDEELKDIGKKWLENLLDRAKTIRMQDSI